MKTQILKLAVILLIVLIFTFPPGLAPALSENNQSQISKSKTNITDESDIQGYQKNSTSQIKQSANILQEHYSKRIRSTPNEDGGTTTEFYIEPSFYLDNELGQQIIETKIESIPIKIKSQDEIDNQDMVTSSGTYQFQSIKNNLKVYFKYHYQPELESNLLNINDDSGSFPITWQPVGVSISNGALIAPDQDFEQFSNTNIRNFDHAVGEVSYNKIIFNDILPGCVEQYSILPNKLKHDFILSRKPAKLFSDILKEQININSNTNYTLNYYGIYEFPQDLYPYIHRQFKNSVININRESNTIISFCSNSGRDIYQMPVPVTYEQGSPRECIRSSYSLIPLGPELSWTRTLVVLRTDLNWLMDEDRNYPVVIDPTIELQNEVDSEVGYDTYLVKGNETDPSWSGYNFGGSTLLKVSLAGPSLYSKKHQYLRSILKFPGIDTIPQHAENIDATLLLNCKNSEPTRLSISVFKLFDDWLEGNGTEEAPNDSGASWNHSGYNIWEGGNYDGYKTNPDTLVVTVNDPLLYKWDVSDIVRSWVKTPGTNHGFLLSGTDGEDVIKDFSSSQTGFIPDRPKLIVNYNTPPTPTGINEIIIYEDDRDVKVEMTDILYDPDEGDVFTYEIFVNDTVGFIKNGIFTNENVTVKIITEQGIKKLSFNPGGSERYSEDNITIRVNDDPLLKNKWIEYTLNVKVLESNDPPEIEEIDDLRVNLPDSTHFYPYINLDSVEGTWEDYFIQVYDPDNKEFFVNETLMNAKFWEGKIIRNYTLPGDIEFEWERDKVSLAKFGVVDDKYEFQPFIYFFPDNSYVGTFVINITVYDTAWYKPPWYPKPKKLRVSNNTYTLIFEVENVNNPPNKPKILEPFPNSEFSTDSIIKFSGKASDPDLNNDPDEKLKFYWYSNIDEFLNIGTEIETELSKGTHLIRLVVEDRELLRSESNVTVIVRNRATIDSENCTYSFTDETDDVICYYYSRSDNGEEIFRLERAGSYPEYNVFIDIEELTSVLQRNYLYINLTVTEDLSLVLDSKNYKYVFSIYLIRPDHSEEVEDLQGAVYDSRRADALYKPQVNEYYANFGLDDGEIVNEGRTLSIKKHLGDLESGEGINAKLMADFSIFATMKVEIKQHPEDSFEHIICYDSAGLGSAPAPMLTPTKPSNKKTEEGLELNVIIPATIIVILIIIILIFGVFILRREGLRVKEKKAKDKTIVYDTTKLGKGAGRPGQALGSGVAMGTGGMQLRQPPVGRQVPGPSQMFHPGFGGMGFSPRPGVGMPGMPGAPMFHPQFRGAPMSPMPDTKSKKRKFGRKKKKK